VYTFSRFFLTGRDSAYKIFIETAKKAGVVLDGSAVRSSSSGGQAVLEKQPTSPEGKLIKVHAKRAEIFGLKTQIFAYKYGCVYKGPNHPLGVIGHIYISTDYLGFYSKLTSLKKLIQIIDIKSMDKARSALFFPNAIKLVHKDGTTHTFDSFWNRDDTFDILNKTWLAKKS